MRQTINDLLNEGLTAKDRIKEIYEKLNGAIVADADLTALNSTSKTAYFRLFLYVFAVLSWIQEGLFSLFKKDTEAAILNGIAPTARWMAQEIRKFQHGDTLTEDPATGRYYYLTEDTAKRIVKRVAINSAGGMTYIKVAGENAEGSAIALNRDQINGLRAFVKDIQPVGANLQTVSYNADMLKADIEVFYNGLYSIEVVRSAVKSAVLGYLAAMDFNGIFYLSKLQDAIQAVEGVTDVVLTNIEARTEFGEYQPIKRIYAPLSGYLKIDPDHSLDNTLIFTSANE